MKTTIMIIKGVGLPALGLCALFFIVVCLSLIFNVEILWPISSNPHLIELERLVYIIGGCTTVWGIHKVGKKSGYQVMSEKIRFAQELAQEELASKIRKAGYGEVLEIIGYKETDKNII